MGSTATVTHSVVDDVNFTFACYPGGRGRRPPLILKDFHVWSRSKEHFCVAGNFLFLNPGRGLSAVWNCFGRDYQFVAQNRLIGDSQ